MIFQCSIARGWESIPSNAPPKWQDTILNPLVCGAFKYERGRGVFVYMIVVALCIFHDGEHLAAKASLWPMQCLVAILAIWFSELLSLERFQSTWRKLRSDRLGLWETGLLAIGTPNQVVYDNFWIKLCWHFGGIPGSPMTHPDEDLLFRPHLPTPSEATWLRVHRQLECPIWACIWRSGYETYSSFRHGKSPVNMYKNLGG